MRSLLLISILVATIAIPIRAAGDSNPTRGLRRALGWMALFNVLYTLACAFVYHHLP